MCCCNPSPNTNTTKPRIGARVDLTFTSGTTPKTHHLPIPIRNLLFHNPTTPSSAKATHVRFFIDNDDNNNNNENNNTIVTITPQSESALSSSDDDDDSSSDDETFNFTSSSSVSDSLSDDNNDILISIQSVVPPSFHPLIPTIPTPPSPSTPSLC